MGSAKYSISHEVKEKFPDIYFAYTFIDGVTVQKSDPRLQEFINQAVTDIRQHLTPESVRAIPSIQTYRQTIKSTGIDPNSHLPSPEALLRRVCKGKDLYKINTAVDAYNWTVIEGAIALGGFDKDHIHGDVTLRFAKEGESMHLLGDDTPTQLKEGQLIYADEEKPLTMDLNYRDIDATKITLATRSIALFADGGKDMPREDVVDALQHGAELITEFCGGSFSEVEVVE